MGLFVGVSTLARKWLAKMTQMAVLAKMAKMTPKAWFSIISDFWGDLTNNRPELFKFRNQLHATRDRIESYRMKLVDSPLDSPASPLQLSVSAAS